MPALFNQLAEQYYDLVRTHRQVEIDSLNYFTLVRALTQRGEEFRLGLASRVQVDQIEQSSLSGLIGLIGTCNRLERDLDSLKLRIGLPTETPVNLDLTELENLTLADEVAVAGQLVQRVRSRLQTEAKADDPNQGELINLAIELIIRMQESYKISDRLGQAAVDVEDLEIRQARLQLDRSGAHRGPRATEDSRLC